jgi:hypothetical protein
VTFSLEKGGKTGVGGVSKSVHTSVHFDDTILQKSDMWKKVTYSSRQEFLRGNGAIFSKVTFFREKIEKSRGRKNTKKHEKVGATFAKKIWALSTGKKFLS